MLPDDACAMNRRSVVTELGPDHHAARPEDRDGIVFDLGLNLLAVDACIRTKDPGTIALLRRAAGENLFGPGDPSPLSSSPPILIASSSRRTRADRGVSRPSASKRDRPRSARGRISCRASCGSAGPIPPRLRSRPAGCPAAQSTHLIPAGTVPGGEFPSALAARGICHAGAGATLTCSQRRRGKPSSDAMRGARGELARLRRRACAAKIQSDGPGSARREERYGPFPASSTARAVSVPSGRISS